MLSSTISKTQSGPAGLTWRVAPAGGLYDEAFVATAGDALRNYADSTRLAHSALSKLRAAAHCRLALRVADDTAGRSVGLRALLRAGLARLRADDPEAAGLLEARFVRQAPLAQFEVQGLARATVLRRSKRALEALAWALWEIECEAWAEGETSSVTQT